MLANQAQKVLYCTALWIPMLQYPINWQYLLFTLIHSFPVVVTTYYRLIGLILGNSCKSLHLGGGKSDMILSWTDCYHRDLLDQLSSLCHPGQSQISSAQYIHISMTSVVQFLEEGSTGTLSPTGYKKGQGNF